MLMDQPERGVIGIGEPPTVSTAAAITNAVRNAIGVTVRSLPLTPAKINWQQDCLRGTSQARGRRPVKRGGDAVKAFSYVNPDERKGSGCRAEPRAEKAMPLGGGQDLLARMKDYVTQPDRIVNVKAALDATVTPMPGGGLKIGAAMKIVDLAEHAQVAKLYPAMALRRDRSRHAADSQPGHRRRQPESAAALLVLPQRGVRLLQEGRQSVLLAGRREPVPRHLRQAARASSSIRRAWRCRRWPTARRSGWSARRASGGRRRPTTSRCRRCRTCDGERARAERAADARDPAGARRGEERALRGALQGVARLADRVRDGRRLR